MHYVTESQVTSMPLIVKGVLCTHTDLLGSDGFLEFTTKSVDFALFHLECVEQVLIAPTHLLPIYQVNSTMVYRERSLKLSLLLHEFLGLFVESLSPSEGGLCVLLGFVSSLVESSLCVGDQSFLPQCQLLRLIIVPLRQLCR